MKTACFSAAILACAMAVGCTSTGSEQKPAPATISFANTDSPGGLAGSFQTLDGRPVADGPIEMAVPAGRRTIGYWCPGTITMDGPPTVKARFEAGKKYVLHCEANMPATVSER